MATLADLLTVRNILIVDDMGEVIHLTPSQIEKLEKVELGKI